ncbi:MAG: hypothetical protein KGJ57_04535 [Sphingomonadales bacterium]|nr:hypothetical protein [Sphingomonadales bacterium]MDE2168681.1 hypothetical protein [Sphingomonadales bacterium]
MALPLAVPAHADTPAFDLAGPDLRVSITREGITLPIGAVPQLAPGDKVKVEALLPADQTAHYLLVAAFLRDPTNPPPGKWFKTSQSWKKAGHGGGPITLTVPAGAQHLALFLAPETGGDEKTLRDAVQARPGAFVRAAQDLEQASLDRSRYDAYLAAIRHISASAPDTLAHLAPAIAQSLHIKINDACLQRPAEVQAACLMDAKQSAVLGGDDSSSTSSLSGAATDLALSVSATPAAGLGYFSPYISAVHEIIGIFGAMHTARYQYIPALGAPHGDRLALALNTPPSFANPKSVLMAALPPIRPGKPPDLHLANAAVAPCFGGASQVLPMASAPLLYATAYARDLEIRLEPVGAPGIDLPLTPDAPRGGLAIAFPATLPALSAGPLHGKVQGHWGFDPFTGPDVTLDLPGRWQWQQSGPNKGDGTLSLTGAPAACVATVTASTGDGTAVPLSWKAGGADELAITFTAKESGRDKTAPITLTITGPQGTAPAHVTITPPPKTPQPAADIIARNIQRPHADQPQAATISLGSPDEIPADARFSFTLKARGNDRFGPRDSVEVATATGDAMTRLTPGNGLTLVDPSVVIASLTPAQALGASAYGPLRARVVRAGVAGDWLALGTLVRLPRITQMICPAASTAGVTGAATKGPPASATTASATPPSNAPCTLSAEGLYLLASLSAKKDFDGAISVPEGYPGLSIIVPRPVDGSLYLRLHDAPEAVNTLTLPRP